MKDDTPYAPYTSNGKIGRWWFWKARMFGKKQIVIDETQYYIHKTYSTTYQGIYYVYKITYEDKE